MDPRLVNLRWSNPVLNALNRSGVKGYRVNTNINQKKNSTFYIPNLKLLGTRLHFGSFDTPEVARAVYDYYKSRAYEVIDALCSRSIHWKIQRRILSYWVATHHKQTKLMKWERDSAYSQLPECGRLE